MLISWQVLFFLTVMRSLENYTVVLRPDDNGTFVAYVPAIAGCHAWGKTLGEAQTELTQVFEMIRAEYQEAGQELPRDVEVAVAHAR
jgi:predicted RNase H-like HicB family nuclease